MREKRQMQIRENYIQSFNQIRRKFGELPCSHLIPENVSLRAAIGYTRRFIVEPAKIVNGKEYRRYDYYNEKIGKALTMFGIDQAKKTIHLDLGCGPGLFSWVIQDYMHKHYRKKPGDLEFIGYDHAQEMIHLANLFQEYLPVNYKFDGYFKVDEIRNMLNSRNFSDCSCIVTLGYVLIQIKDNREALQDFVQIIQDLFPAKSCILLAVDAYNSESWRQDFRDTCKALWGALTSAGINVNSKPIGYKGSTMYARLSR